MKTIKAISVLIFLAIIISNNLLSVDAADHAIHIKAGEYSTIDGLVYDGNQIASTTLGSVSYAFSVPKSGYYELNTNMGFRTILDEYGVENRAGANVDFKIDTHNAIRLGTHNMKGSGSMTEADMVGWRCYPYQYNRAVYLESGPHTFTFTTLAGYADWSTIFFLYDFDLRPLNGFVCAAESNALSIGRQTTMKVGYQAVDGRVVSNAKVTYASSDENVATVGRKGEIFAVGYGFAFIYTRVHKDDGTTVQYAEPLYVLQPNEEMAVDNVVFDKGSGTITLDMFFANETVKGTVFAAVYDDLGVLLSVDSVPFASGSTKRSTVVLKPDADISSNHVRFYFWDSVEKMKPLSVQLNNNMG
ncbi:MAG: hypothetical protein RSA27_01365 [Oscillospiraceae bacterium]